MKNIFLISTLVLLMACGGGGGGDSSETDDAVTGLTTPSNMSVVTAD